jgi:exopolysaccharide biosynthesis polyprenyl glycosylphosphotransferase
VPAVPIDSTARVPDERVRLVGSHGAQARGRSARLEGPRNNPGRAPRISLRLHLATGDVVALGAIWGSRAAVHNGPRLGQQVTASAVAFLVTLAVMRRSGLYLSRVCALRSAEAVRVFAASAAGTGASVISEALAGRVHVADLVEMGAVSAVAVLLLRWRFTRWLKTKRAASKYLRTIVMVGTNEDAEGLWALLGAEPELGYRIGGVAGEPRAGAPWLGVLACAATDRIGALAGDVGASGVMVVASALSPVERAKAVNAALDAGLHVQVWPGLHGVPARRTHMTPLSGIPLLYVERKGVTRSHFVVKRVLDLVLGTSLAVLTAPVLAVAALAVKLADGGPVIYRSERVGRNGRRITVLKLRTMVPGAALKIGDVAAFNERTGGPLFKASRDPRVTAVGRVLRATSIDELPQLWNVLNGTMSLVGPRPALPHEVEHFDEELHRRHEMRPGMTGLWQVEARDNPSFSAYRRLDLSYVDHWSLGLDMAILASTVHEIAARSLRALFSLRSQCRAGQDARPVPDRSEKVIELDGEPS